MNCKSLNKVIEKPITGEWGSEGNNVKVLRTTNFTNEGRLNLNTVVTRNISENKIESKKLKCGDTIIEKSGGSPNQPVGRVVYFDIKNETYLCNNFTSILRPQKNLFPKYLFYFLFSRHLYKATLAYQNKTTGIINLQLTRYLTETQIPLPPLLIQQKIANIIDKADAIRQANKQILEKYDILAQSVFLEMFGDPVTNHLGWKKFPLKQFGKIITGNTPSRKVVEYYGDFIEWIKTDNINTPNIFLTKSAEGLSRNGLSVGRKVNEGAILVTCIAGSKKVIGNVAIANRPVSFNQQINALELSTGNTIFMYYQFLLSKKYVQTFSTNSMKGMISKSNFERIEFISPPLELQNNFASIIEKVEQQKDIAQQGIDKSEELFQSLLQRAFKGELFHE